jgi:hypothetical protein
MFLASFDYLLLYVAGISDNDSGPVRTSNLTGQTMCMQEVRMSERELISRALKG